MSYSFLPNDFARNMFNLKAARYDGAGITPLLESTLGVDNYRQYVFAQDPLSGGKTEGTVKIIMNKGVLDLRKMNLQDLRYETIGTIRRL